MIAALWTHRSCDARLAKFEIRARTCHEVSNSRFFGSCFIFSVPGRTFFGSGQEGSALSAFLLAQLCRSDGLPALWAEICYSFAQRHSMLPTTERIQQQPGPKKRCDDTPKPRPIPIPTPGYRAEDDEGDCPNGQGCSHLNEMSFNEWGSFRIHRCKNWYWPGGAPS